MVMVNSYVNVCQRLRMGKSAIIGDIMIHTFIIPGKSWQDVSHEDLCRIYAALKGIQWGSNGDSIGIQWRSLLLIWMSGENP